MRSADGSANVVQRSTASSKQPHLDGRQQQPLRVVGGTTAVVGANSVHLLRVAATDYRAALLNDNPAMDQYLVSMPSVKFQFTRGGGDRIASLDSGAVMCCISEKAYKRDKDVLGGSLRHLSSPLSIKTFNNQSTTTNTILVGAQIVIGRAVYPMQLVVVPGASYDYLLGANFMAEYDVTLGFRSCAAFIGVTARQLLPGNSLPWKGRQQVPLFYRGRVVTWACTVSAAIHHDRI